MPEHVHLPSTFIYWLSEPERETLAEAMKSFVLHFLQALGQWPTFFYEDFSCKIVL